MEILPFQLKYQKAVLELHELAFKQSEYVKKYSWNPKLDNDLLKINEVYLDNKGTFLLWVEDEKLIGMGALLRSDDKTAIIKRIRVNPAYQRQGMSSIILSELEKRANQLGYRKLLADTARNNLPAKKMLLKAGFRLVNAQDFRGVLFEKDLSKP